MMRTNKNNTMSAHPLQEINISNLSIINDSRINIPIHIKNKSNSKYEKSLFLPIKYTKNVSIANLFDKIEKCVTDNLNKNSNKYNFKILYDKSFIDDKTNNDESIIEYKKNEIMEQGIYIEINENNEKQEYDQDLLEIRLKQLCVSRNGDPAYEYFNDIMKCFKEREEEYLSLVDSNYIENIQSTLTWKMREILIDWFFDLEIDLRLNEETLFAAIHFVDIFLTKINLKKRSLLQLLGVSCILIATKTYEIIPQQVSELIYLSNDQYTKREVLNFERMLLTKINWNAFQLTPYNFTSPWLNILNIQQKSKEKLLIDLLIYSVSLNKYYFQIKLSKLVISVLYLTLFIYLEYGHIDTHRNNKLNGLFRIISKLFSFNPFVFRQRNNNDNMNNETRNIMKQIHKILMQLLKKGKSSETSAIYRRFTNRNYLKNKYGSFAATIDIDTFPFHQNFKKYNI